MVNLYLGVRVFTFAALPLGGLEFDLFRLISWNSSAIPQTVEHPLLRYIVGIEKAFSHRDKADKKSACTCFFTFSLCQWDFPNSSFQLGRLPGTYSFRINVAPVGLEGTSAGIRKPPK